MAMTIGVIVPLVITSMRFSCEVAANKEREAKSRNQQSRPDAQPRVESFREDPLRCVERNDAKSVHRYRMGRGYDRTEQHRMTGLTMRSNQISGDQRLAMPGFKRVKST